MLNVYLSLSPLDPLSPPGRGIERTREVLCLAGTLAIAELHDANRVDWPLIVADHVLGDPQVAASEHAPDGEAQLGRVVPAQGLHVMPAADPLTRLGIFYHDVIVLDLVFGVQVTPVEACNGYLGYPFTKLTIWPFTTFLFFFGKWYSIMEVIGKIF